MPLPQVNEVPRYTATIPSTKQKITYRPFLVKEQKVLLIALESQESDEMYRAITDTIKSCIHEDIDVNKLATFDIEYLFLQIRSRSVGESSPIRVKCSKCEEFNEISVNLDSISIDIDQKSKNIKLNDNYTLVMKYPSYETVTHADESNTVAESLYNNIIMCLDVLKTPDEAILFQDEPREEIVKFIDNLTSEQFETLIEFTSHMPALSHDIEFTCNKCGHENKRTLRGLADFF